MNIQSELNLEKIKGFESEGVDLNKFDKISAKIDKVEVTQVLSNFTNIDATGLHLKQWCLKVSSEVLETLGEGDKKIEFRASELYNLIQDENGSITGFPTGNKSNLGKFLKDLKVDPKELNLKQLVEQIKGKSVIIKAYDKDAVGTDGRTNKRTYLKFRY